MSLEPSFFFPVDVPYHIGLRFGDSYPEVVRQILHIFTPHRGVDIISDLPAYNDVLVRAPASGPSKTYWHYQGGNCIDILTTYGSNIGEKLSVRTWLCHFKKFLIPKVGSVEAGQVIGVMDSTGLSTGRHLHWQVYINGQLVDPLIYVRQKFMLDNAIIRNTKDGSFAFIKASKKQPLSYKTMAFALTTVQQVHGKDAYNFLVNVSDESYKGYALTWDYFGGEDEEFKLKHAND